MNAKKMTLAEQKYLMKRYPNRVVLPYLKLSADMACWLLENPSKFHDEIMARYYSGEIYYGDLVSLLESESGKRVLFDTGKMESVVNRKTGAYFTEKIEPGANVSVRPITARDIKGKYVVNWLSEINDRDEINGSFLDANPRTTRILSTARRITSTGTAAG
jgi:hypothetical protein